VPPGGGPGELAGPDRAADLVAVEVRAVLAGPEAARAFAAVEAARGRGEEPDPRPLYRLLGARRLLAPCWPHAHGGRQLPPRCAAAVVGELVAAGVPEVLHTLSVQICGNFLLAAGTREQRTAVLPGLAAGTLACTVLYSEPDAGSDLSSLDTRAEPAGGGRWRITGRKVYSVATRLADFGLVAARTSVQPSPYQGITLFLVPLDAAGVSVEVLPSFADDDFGDVRLAGVEVPAGAVVGPVGGAWPLVTDALALERTGVDYVAKAELWLRTWQAAATPPPAPPDGPPAGAMAAQPATGGRLRPHTAADPAASTAADQPPDQAAGDVSRPRTAVVAVGPAASAAAGQPAGLGVGAVVGQVAVGFGRLRTRTAAARALAMRCVDQQGSGRKPHEDDRQWRKSRDGDLGKEE